jgi:hypothetical protein
MLSLFRSSGPTFALGGLVLALSLASTAAATELRITEAMSSSGIGGTPDWFEVTNYGLSAVDITGFKMDDSSNSFAVSVALNGVTNINPGESVVFIETASPLTAIPAFQTFWGGINSIQIGSYSGSGVGLSSVADGIVLFDSLGSAQTPLTSFGAATTGSSFYWAYDSAGDFVPGFGSASAGLVSTAGTIFGSSLNQVAFVSTDLLGNIGSPGSAAVAVPEPSTVALAAVGLCMAGVAVRRRAA